tara:strand:+ start:441 stop:602 length:162 start_codon:yes stop_codon:yes gene_type:complete
MRFDSSLATKITNMRRLIYDMYYAEEISMEICGKLINKLNEVSEKRRKKHGGY